MAKTKSYRPEDDISAKQRQLSAAKKQRSKQNGIATGHHGQVVTPCSGRPAESRWPNSEDDWQYIRKRYCRNSRHIIEAPDYPELQGKEVVIVEAPRRGMKTVRIEVDNVRQRWPVFWLRPIITDEMRAAIQKNKPPRAYGRWLSRLRKVDCRRQLLDFFDGHPMKLLIDPRHRGERS